MRTVVKSVVGAAVTALVLTLPGLAHAAPTPTPVSPTASATATASPLRTASAAPAELRYATPIETVYQTYHDQLGAPLSEEFDGANNTSVVRFANGVIIMDKATSQAYAVYGAIYAKYGAYGWEGGVLGRPLSNETSGPGDVRVSRFERGLIVWTPARGAFAVHGTIAGKYLAAGGLTSTIGQPTSDEFAAGRSSRGQRFSNGLILWSSGTGAQIVQGRILDSYAALGFENGVLGLPISDEFTGAAAGSRVSRFQGGIVVWSAGTAANPVYGAILEAYGRLVYEGGPLGLPTSGEFTAGRGARAVNFQRGIILWTPGTGANPVYGAIFGKYRQLGSERAVLGLPRTPEFAGVGSSRVQNYENGQILWSAATGANSVYGSIAQAYASMGWEGGPLGLPVTDELAGQNGARVNRFQSGVIIWTARTGAFAVRGAIGDEYARNGWEGGSLGAPIGAETPVDGGWTQDFERGRIAFVNGRFGIIRPGPAVDPRCRTGRVMCISKADRKLRWMVDGQVVRELDARFGSTSTPTREGEFTVFRKIRDEWSYLYNSPMPFSMYFSGGQAVHYSADFAARGYSGASHGCINIRDYAGIQWLYDTQVRVGDRVVVSW